MAKVKNEITTPLYAEQVSLLYDNAPLAYAVTLINGMILVFLQRTYTPTVVLIAWFTCLILVTVSRASLVYFAHSQITPSNARYWGRAYLVGVGLAGILWGSTAVLFFPVESIIH